MSDEKAGRRAIGFYAQLDVDWIHNPKRIRAGLEASAIHAMSLCLAKKSTKDGWVDIDSLAVYGATPDHIDRLVNCGLLDVDGTMVRPHDWLEVNLSTDEVKQRKSESGRMANHARWHEGTFAACVKCCPPKPETPRSSEPDPVGVQTDPSEAKKKRSAEPDPNPAAARQQRINAACRQLAEERAALRDDVGPGWIAAAARGIATDHHQALHGHLVANPDATTHDLIDIIEATPTARPKPEDRLSLAARELEDRQRRREDGTACPECGDNGVILGDDGLARPCKCRRNLKAVPA